MANPVYAKDQAKRRIVLKRDIRKAGYTLPADTPTEALELIHALIKAREERTAIVIVMEDGVIHDAITTVPMDCMVIDYAPVAETNPDQFIKVDWGEGRSSEAVVSLTEPEVHADYVVGRLKAYRDSNGKEC